MALTVLPSPFVHLSFVKSLTCSFSLCILHTSYSYVIILHHFSQPSVSVKVSVLVCFCSFDLSCSVLEKDNFIKKNILYCLVKY